MFYFTCNTSKTFLQMFYCTCNDGLTQDRLSMEQLTESQLGAQAVESNLHLTARRSTRVMGDRECLQQSCLQAVLMFHQ